MFNTQQEALEWLAAIEAAKAPPEPKPAPVYKRYALEFDRGNGEGLKVANVYARKQPRTGQEITIQRQRLTVKSVELLTVHNIKFGDILLP